MTTNAQGETVGISGAVENTKTLTVIVPSYNVETCLGRCITSLLSIDKTDDIEIIIVDDGSQDGTAQLADTYAAQNNQCIRVIHQENAGHGGAVNTGVAAARGLYTKIVDADDWVDAAAYKEVMSFLREQAKNTAPVDLVLTNYVYENQAKKLPRVMSFKHSIDTNKILTWDNVRDFYISQYLLMHTMIYKTSVLRKSGMKLPEHTFYVDFIYAYQPLPYVKTLTYLDVDFYRYFIGREGQSVEKETMIRRVDQLIRVNRLMVQATPEKETVPRGLYRYMIHFLSIDCVVTSVFLILSKKKENYEAKNQLWNYIKEYSPQISKDVRSTLLCLAVNLPGKTGRFAVRAGYLVARSAVGFN